MPKLGISGRIAGFFLASQLTPLVALVALLLGVFAVLVTPREEEPQINVTMANVLVPFPGASADDVEQLVAIPAEQVLAQIPASSTCCRCRGRGMAMVTVQFKVGVPRSEAVVRLHDTIYPTATGCRPNSASASRSSSPRASTTCRSSRSRYGRAIRSAAPTIWSASRTRSRWNSSACRARAKCTTIGGPGRVLQVLLDTERLAAHGVAAQRCDARAARRERGLPAGKLVRGNRDDAGRDRRLPRNRRRTCAPGRRACSDGQPGVRRGRRARVDGPPTSRSATCGTASARRGGAARQRSAGTWPAVTLQVTKKPARTRSRSRAASRNAWPSFAAR